MGQNKPCNLIPKIVVVLTRKQNETHKGSQLLEHNEPSQTTPCRDNIEVYDSRYLSDFDALAFLEENPDVRGSKEKGFKGETDALLRAEVLHKMAQANAVAQAKALCGKCPIKDACLEWVIATETEGTLIYGVAAGYTQKERVQAMRRRAS